MIGRHRGRKDKRKQSLMSENIKERSEAKIKEFALIRGDSSSFDSEGKVKLGINLDDFVKRESRGRNPRESTSDDLNFLHKIIDNRVWCLRT